MQNTLPAASYTSAVGVRSWCTQLGVRSWCTQLGVRRTQSASATNLTRSPPPAREDGPQNLAIIMDLHVQNQGTITEKIKNELITPELEQ